MISIIDYGLGNIKAFANIYRQLNLPFRIVSEPTELAGANKIILPGVGAFDWAMTRLNASGLRDALDRAVLYEGAHILGVCVGMQMMARRSEEGQLAGLSWFDADVRKFDIARLALKTQLPHMGWNTIKVCKDDGVLAGLMEARFYFLHSFHFVPRDKSVITGRADYGGEFAAAVRTGNIYGTQFHPEKSHGSGIALLKNFAEL